MDAYIKKIITNVADYDPISILELTPRRLESHLLSFFEPDWERSYAPGKWNARELFAHFADVELGLGFRFRQVLSEDNHQPQPFDQDAWLERSRNLDPSLALETFRALRSWNLALFTTFDLDDWNRPINYPYAGINTPDMLVRFLAGHDLNHLKQLELIAEGLQEVSGTDGAA